MLVNLYRMEHFSIVFKFVNLIVLLQRKSERDRTFSPANSMFANINYVLYFQLASTSLCHCGFSTLVNRKCFGHEFQQSYVGCHNVFLKLLVLYLSSDTVKENRRLAATTVNEAFKNKNLREVGKLVFESTGL